MKPNTEAILKILTEDPDSPLYRLINKPVPTNDLEYIDLWSYLKGSEDEYNDVLEFIESTWKQSDLSDTTERFHLWKKLKNIIKDKTDEKFAQMNFTPRIIMYANTFDEEETENIRKLLLYLFSGGSKHHNITESPNEIGKKINIDRRWVIGLTKDHRLFTDGVIQLEESYSTSKTDPIFNRDIKAPGPVQKLFCGIELSEMDYMAMPLRTLLDFFEIKIPAHIRELIDEVSVDEEKSSEAEYDTTDFDADDPVDIDTLLSKIQQIKEASELEVENDDDDQFGQQASETDSEENESETQQDVSQDEESADVQPYTSDIDYLHEEYLLLKILSELKEKKEERYVIREEEREEELKYLRQNYTRQKKKCELRLIKTRKTNFLPRLIFLAENLNLNRTELDVVKILAIKQIFSFEENYSPSTTVGEILGILFEDVREMIKAKRIFLRTSRLVRSNLIQLERRSLDSNFFNINITIDSKLLEYLGGEDYDIENYVEDSKLFKPEIRMEDVVIPETEKKDLLKKIENFPFYLEAKRKIDIGTHVHYGDAFVMVSTGPSGVGKTMLAHAIANHLDKRLLTVNLHNISHVGYLGSDDKGVFGLLFREAKMNDAILFFDEAESLLEKRINDLLIDIEKHNGIVIFATNASFTIDEAMRRRINHIQQFDEPGPQLRKKIWQYHLPKNYAFGNDVDISYLALRYEINGGLIKNAVNSAFSWASADANGKTENIVISMDHLKKGASEQLQNKLFMSKLERNKAPQRGFDSAVFSEKTLNSLRSVASFEKAQKVLYGEWGFKEVYPESNGTVGLLHGPSGTGKSLAAEIIAYETGRTLKIVNYSQLVSKYVGDTEKNIETLFTKVKNDKSILLFDEADAIFAKRTNVNAATDRYANMETNELLSMIEQNDIFVILTTNIFENIDPAFLRRFKFTIEFEVPDQSLRAELWKKLVPPRMPVADDVDYQVLAKQFQFTGGDIKNAIMRAASIRAVDLEHSTAVTQKDFIDACKEMTTIKQDRQKGIGFNSES